MSQILDSDRQAVVEGIGDIHQDSLSVVMDAFLPRINQSTIANIKKRFLKVPLAERIARPSTTTTNENVTFSLLCPIVNEIGEIASSLLHRPVQVEMIASPYRAPTGGPNTMPDALFKLLRNLKSVQCSMAIDNTERLNSFDNVSWADAAGPCEWKKRNTLSNIKDDSRKVVWSMAQILALDPCRTAVFGITMEDAFLRLWYFDRSGSIVSHSIDIYTETDSFIELFARIMTASPSDLGYDDTVSRVVVDETEQFEFKVSVPESKLPIVYRTVKLLSNYAADRISGKATRVWVVKRETQESARKRHTQSTQSERQFGERLYVLKDSWVEERRTREGEFYQEIHAAIAKLPEDEQAKTRRHFLTVDSCCDVSPQSIHGKLATTCPSTVAEDAPE